MNLIKCTSCNLNSYTPVMDQCHEVPNQRWFIVTRCTGCGNRREVYVNQKTANQFDAALDLESRKLWTIIARNERQAMEDYAQRFTAALDADALLPEDFRV